MLLNPQHLTISNLLKGRLFRIPDYQRAYAWGRRQREDLFKDILGVKTSGRDHFMATVVCLARDKHRIGADEYQAVEIVDGQQRITTLVILLKAIAKKLDVEDAGESRVLREISELLVKNDDHSLILLQTNHDSSNIFMNYIRNGAIYEAEALTAADKNCLDAAGECEEFVDLWAQESDLIDLVAILRNQLSLIYHEIDDEATVYRVFEVLNSRGLDVKWIDKFKSQLMASIFEYVEPDTQRNAVQEMRVIWQEIYREVGLRDELSDWSLRFAGTLATGSKQSKILGQEAAATELIKAAGDQVRSIIGEGERLKAVVLAVSRIQQDSRLSAVTKILHARFVAVAIQLSGFNDEEKERLLGSWERVTFRIFGLGGADARNLVGEYVRLGCRIYSGEISVDEVDEDLIALGAGYQLEDILGEEGYWADCYDGWKEELRYLLFRYDEVLAKKGGIVLNKNQWNQVWTVEPGKSIEHIKPQNSEVEYLHHVGNLTMLPPGVNSALGAKPPIKKAQTYQDSGMLGTRAVGNKILENIDRSNKDPWTEEDVRARAMLIDEFVRREWGD